MNIKIVENWNDFVPMLVNHINNCIYTSRYPKVKHLALNYTETVDYINASRENNDYPPLKNLDTCDDSFTLLENHFDEFEIRGILMVQIEDEIICVKEFYEDKCGDDLDDVLVSMTRLHYSSNNLTYNPHNVDEITNTSSSICNILTKPPFIK